MPSTFVRHIPIDSEWAEALVGLRLNIPNSWWPGFVDGGLNRGRIAAINFDALNAYYFEVELDDELGAHYAMRYDSVLLYADEGQPGFSRFRLPMMCTGNPDDEVARVKVLRGKNGGAMVDDNFTDVDGPVNFFDSRDDDVSDTADDADADDGSYSEGAPATKKKRKKGAMTKTGGKRATKRNKKRRHNNNTINPDLVLLSGDGDADTMPSVGSTSGGRFVLPVFRLYSMALNNAYKMYTALVKEHTSERRFLSMGDAVRELTHDLCQRGPAMRKLRAEHPSWTQDLGKLFGWMTGRKVWSDAKGMMTVMPVCPPVEAPMDNYALLKNQQRKSPWRIRQSKAVAKKGRCGWEDCPGKLASKGIHPRSSDTHMRCEECSARLGKDMYLCNGFIKGAPVNCHRHYHIYNHNKEIASTMVIN
jgi:hypothetical protein